MYLHACIVILRATHSKLEQNEFGKEGLFTSLDNSMCWPILLCFGFKQLERYQITMNKRYLHQFQEYIKRVQYIGRHKLIHNELYFQLAVLRVVPNHYIIILAYCVKFSKHFCIELLKHYSNDSIIDATVKEDMTRQ